MRAMIYNTSPTRESIYQPPKAQRSSLFPTLPPSLPPSIRATAERVEDSLVWTLPSKGTKLLRQYKITWSVRVGKNVRSGTVIPFSVYVQGEWGDEVEVLVK